MSYTITHANGANSIVIADGTVDNSTSITLVGKNTANYGQYLDQNFLNMLENFANGNSPANPIVGQIWYNSTKGALQVYNGSIFKNIASATASSTPPSGAVVGDLWFDTANQQLDVYSGTGWVIIGPLGGAGQVVSESITDTSSVSHSVISMKISNTRYAILSKDAAFTPSSTISGFSTINPGFNIASTAFVSNNKFWGQSSDAAALNGVSGSSFMRNDQNTGTVGILSVTNNSGIALGTSGQGSFNIYSNEMRVENTVNNGIIRLRTRNSSGGVADALDILANADVQVNGNLFVLGNLDVTTSNETSIVSGTQTAYNTTSGAFQVVGGVGIGGNIIVGGPNSVYTGNVYIANLIANGSTNNGQISAATITGGVIGNSGATLTGTISQASQTNITTLGTLTSLAVSGAAGFTNGTVTFNPTSSYKLILGAVGNVQITGGTSGQALTTDGSGNLSWYTIPTPVGSGASQYQVAVYTNSTNISGASGLTYNGSTLAVTGAITATGDITAFYSDQRLKTNVTEIPNALDKVKAISGITYNSNDLAASLGIGDDREHVGVIAQQVQEVLPQVVVPAPFDIDPVLLNSKSGENYLTVQYDKLVPLLIQAIKELSAEVEALKARGN
jgi:Chaperone of endosialidase